MILPESSCEGIISNLQPMTIAIQLHLPTLEDFQRKYIALNLTDQVRHNCCMFHVLGPTSCDTKTVFPEGTHRKNTHVDRIYAYI